MDQARHHAAGPGPGVHFALEHDPRVDAGDFPDDVLEADFVAEGFLLLEQLFHRRVVEHPLGVAQRAHDQPGLQLVGLDDGLFHIFVNRRLDCGHEAGSHVHALGAHRERGDERAPVGLAAGGDEGDFKLVRGPWQQDHVGNVVLARVAGAFEAVDARGVAADALGLEGVAHRGAFVDHLDAGVFQVGQHRLRIVARGFHRLDAAVDDGLDDGRVVRRVERGQESQIDADGLVGHVLGPGDLVGEVLRRLLGQRGDDAKPSRLGDRRGEFGETDIVHPALDDGMFDAEQFGDSRLHVDFPSLANRLD